MMTPPPSHDLPRERIVDILESRNVAEIVVLLQDFFLKAPAFMDAGILDSIHALAAHPDLRVRFWSKKVFRKYSFRYRRDEPDHVADSAAGEPLPLDSLIRTLQDARHSKFLAMKVLKKICQNGSSQALEFLTGHLKSTADPFQLSFLVKNLGRHFPSDALIPALTPFLTHEDDRIIANCIEGLEAIGSSRCFEIISRCLKHSNNRVRATAAKAIASFDTRRPFDILNRMLGTKGQPHLVISACHAVGELRDPRFFPSLQNLLNDDLVLDDALRAMRAADKPRTMEVLHSQIEREEARLDRMKRFLAGMEQGESPPERPVTPVSQAFAPDSPPWTAFLSNRLTLAIIAAAGWMFAGCLLLAAR